MKNITKAEVKSCIVKEWNEYESIVKQIYAGHKIDLSYSEEGISHCIDDDCPYIDDLYEKLANYFDVKEVQSIHIDDSDYSAVMVWICYCE